MSHKENTNRSQLRDDLYKVITTILHLFNAMS